MNPNPCYCNPCVNRNGVPCIFQNEDPHPFRIAFQLGGKRHEFGFRTQSGARSYWDVLKAKGATNILFFVTEGITVRS